MHKPNSRNENIAVQQTSKEVLIYDLSINKVFCLNQTSTMVWNACDGKKSTPEIAKVLKIPEDAVWLALDQLKDEGLIENCEDSSSYFKGLSRREVIKKVGLASMVALPIVVSITAPKATNAASGECPSPGVGNNSIQNNCNCANGTDCQTGCCDKNLTICIPINVQICPEACQPPGNIPKFIKRNDCPCVTGFECQSSCCNSGICETRSNCL